MKRFINDTKKYAHYTLYSARSELKAEVANSYLNWLWWILDPLCLMFIYTFIFTVAFERTEPYFPVFIFIGLTLWNFFSKNLTNSVKMIRTNKAIVSKVYMPKFILLYSKTLVNGFKMLISLGIVAIMMIVYRVPVGLNTLYFFPILLVLMLLTFGICTHILHYGVFIDDLSNVVSIVLKFLFYLTGIFFDVETRIPDPYNVFLAKFNPFAFLISSARNALLYNRAPDLLLTLLWFVIALILIVTGIRKIYKNENSYVKVI